LVGRFLALVAVTAAVVSLTSVTAGAQRSIITPRLLGTVGPGFTIKLTTATHLRVVTLKARRYAFVVSDKSPIHNFVVERISGAAFEKTLTTVPGTGIKTVFVTLTRGKYKFFCAPHQSQMFGLFTVK
jgi:hypothetical protein